MKKNPTRNLPVLKGNASTKGLPAPKTAGAVANAKISTSPETEVVFEGPVTLISAATYHADNEHIDNVEVYFVEGSTPHSDGPWLGEADKLAWRDPTTGFECIMLRDTHGGHLCGYVGIPTTHPLHGFDHRAIPASLGISTHGGLCYSAICDEGPTPARRPLAREARRICHAPRTAEYAKTRHATSYRVQDAHAWWLGFACNQIYDIIPNDQRSRRQFLKEETRAEYRDDAYVLREIQHLAAQLKAIADGAPMPQRTGPPPPPIGLDPHGGDE